MQCCLLPVKSVEEEEEEEETINYMFYISQPVFQLWKDINKPA